MCSPICRAHFRAAARTENSFEQGITYLEGTTLVPLGRLPHEVHR